MVLSDEADCARKRWWMFASLVPVVVLDVWMVAVLQGLDHWIAVFLLITHLLVFTTRIPNLFTKRAAENVVAAAHILFGILTLLLPFVSQTPQMLGYLIWIMIITMAMRRILNGCPWRSSDGHKTDWADPGFNWDYVFPVSASVATARLVCKCTGTNPLAILPFFQPRRLHACPAARSDSVHEGEHETRSRSPATAISALHPASKQESKEIAPRNSTTRAQQKGGD